MQPDARRLLQGLLPMDLSFKLETVTNDELDNAAMRRLVPMISPAQNAVLVA